MKLYLVHSQLGGRDEPLLAVFTGVVPHALVNLDVSRESGRILEYLPALWALEALSVAVLEVHGTDVPHQVAGVVEGLVAVLAGEGGRGTVVEPLVGGQSPERHEGLAAGLARILSLTLEQKVVSKSRTEHFTILEHQNPSIGEFYTFEKC